MKFDVLVQKVSAAKNGWSKWNKAVKEDALALLDDYKEEYGDGDVFKELLHKRLLSGAKDWEEYSFNGCALIYDRDIMRKYCTPSEIKVLEKRRYLPSEYLLKMQAGALHQAEYLIFSCLCGEDK